MDAKRKLFLNSMSSDKAEINAKVAFIQMLRLTLKTKQRQKRQHSLQIIRKFAET